MNRRFFLFDLFTVLTLGMLSQPSKVKPKLHTDFEYASIDKPNRLSPDAHPRPKDLSNCRRDAVMPYLNGKLCRGVQEGNAVEGWLDVMDDNWNVRRVYGDVQLLWATKERRDEFAKLCGF